jgi:hypothetical protein
LCCLSLFDLGLLISLWYFQTFLTVNISYMWFKWPSSLLNNVS